MTTNNDARVWLRANGHGDVVDQIDAIMDDWRRRGVKTRRNWWDAPRLCKMMGCQTAIVHGGANIACGVNLDLCRKMREPDAPRWDYVFVERGTDHGVAIEVHHTDPDEVDRMIEKKQWAEELLAEQCPDVKVLGWIWLASPPAGRIFILPQSPNARRLAEARIRFPQVSVTLP